MYTRNSSIDQAGIFNWLTSDQLNGHFGTAISGNGQKFLLNNKGELQSVFDAGTALSNKLMDFVVHTPF